MAIGQIHSHERDSQEEKGRDVLREHCEDSIMQARYNIYEQADAVRNMPVTLEVTMTVMQWRHHLASLKTVEGYETEAAGEWRLLVQNFVFSFEKKLSGGVEMGPYFTRDEEPPHAS